MKLGEVIYMFMIQKKYNMYYIIKTKWLPKFFERLLYSSFL